MKTKKTWWILPVLVAALAPAARAQEEGAEPVFLSLTRSEEPLRRMPSNVSVLTADDIRRSGADTLDEALDLMPSVDLSRTGTRGSLSSLRLRAVPDSKQVQVVVDDQPLAGVSIQDLDVSQIPVDNIERIEIVRGASSVLYGANTIGGVVHIITKRHRDPRPRSSVGYEARSFKTQDYRADIGARGKRADLYVAASKFATDGFQRNADAEGVALSAAGGVSFQSGARLGLELARTDREAGVPAGTPVPLGQWDGRRERQANNTLARVEQDIDTARLKAVLPLGGWGSVQSTAYGSAHDYFYNDPNPSYPTVSDLDKNVVGNDTRFLLPGKTTVGLSYERDTLIDKGVYPVRAHIVDWGAYLQKTLTLANLDLIPALRFDQHGAFGNTYNPRLTAVLRMSDAWRLSANAARSFRAPTLVNLYQDFPDPFYPFYANPRLRPETAWTYDLGSRFRLSDRSELSVTGHHTRIRERITTNAAFDSNINAPRAEISGVEAESSIRLGGLESRLNYTYQRAIGNSLSGAHNLPLRLTPRHLANGQLLWTSAGGWSMTQTAQYVHKQHSVDGEKGVKLPSYTLWNVRLSKQILGAELYFAADNLTDKHYAEAVYSGSQLYPQPGRTFWGGINIQFMD